MDVVEASVQVIRQHLQSLEIIERVIIADLCTLLEDRLKQVLVNYLLGIRRLRSTLENLEADLLHEVRLITFIEVDMNKNESEPY